jgi:hypothetical protein
MDMMDFGYRLYPSYKGYNGVGGKGIDKMGSSTFSVGARN